MAEPDQPPAEEHEVEDQTSGASSSGESSGTSEQTGKAPAISTRPMGLSRKLATISSVPERTAGKSEGDQAPWSEHVRVYSTLPEALSKMDRKMRVDELSDKLSQVEQALEEEEYNEVLHVEDPNPGVLISGVWFLFSFGKFVRGPMLRQSKREVLGLLLFLSVTMCSQGMEWTHPALVSTKSFLFLPEFYARLGWIMAAAVVGFFALGLLVNWALGTWEKRAPGFLGVRIVVNAFLPLALIQLSLLLLQWIMYGEAYWRGMRWVELQHISETVLLLFWGYSGFRVAEAIFASRRLALPTQVFLKFAAFLLGILPGVALHAEVVESRKQPAVVEWGLASQQALAPGHVLDEDQLHWMESHLPLRSVGTRQDLYLTRLQHYFRQRNVEAASDNALMLEHISPDGTAMDELALGLQDFLEGRLDLAVPHWKTAVRMDPNCVPVHQWLALAEMANDMADAERHARILMKIDPNVFHFYLFIRVLAAQEKTQDIWEAQFEVNAPVTEWYPLTVYQVGEAARELGMEKRAIALIGPPDPEEAPVELMNEDSSSEKKEGTPPESSEALDSERSEAQESPEE